MMDREGDKVNLAYFSCDMRALKVEQVWTNPDEGEVMRLGACSLGKCQ